MGELIQGDETPYIPPQVEDVGEAFVEWAEKFWGIKQAYDKPSDPNSESASWEIVKPYFVDKINELVKNKKPSGLQPGYYQLNLKSE